MQEPVWLTIELIEAIHDRQLSEHGGSSGLRDRGMLESALARAPQKFAYGGMEVDIPELAAAYCLGIAGNHPFVDGNKRTAAVACEVFMEMNGYRLLADDPDLYPIFLGVAAGEICEADLVDWLRQNARPDQVSEDKAEYG